MDKESDGDRMKKILVLVAGYPNNEGSVSLMYVHTRNKYYQHENMNVTVLSFSTVNDYMYDGIKVISLKTYVKTKEQYDILILHAANIRNHYLFLKKYENNFKHLIFFYHGHEVLKITKVYSKPYDYVNRSRIKDFLQNCYDSFKLNIWKNYIPLIRHKADFVFVSQWMYDEFLLNVGIDENEIKDKSHITYNSIGKDFEIIEFDDKCVKEFDFITVRSYLDNSKYAVDIVNKLAKNTPNANFVLIGKGDFFNHNTKSDNLKWIDKTMSHKEIIDMLQKSRYALMPTRTDAQGLMMCEMAAFGIPVITSDIPVCHEIFGEFENVYYINNEVDDLTLYEYLQKKSVSNKHTRFYQENTVKQEVKLIRDIFEKL